MPVALAKREEEHLRAGILAAVEMELGAERVGFRSSEVDGGRDQLAARIAELERLKHGLTECIGCGCLSLDRCELSNAGDRAAGLGPGPRYWLGDRPLT